MASFYFPKQLTINTIPVIIYPCTGIEKVFDRKKKNSLEEHVEDLYEKHTELHTGEYHIIILWNDNTDRMTDIWIFDKIESWGSGPLVDAKIYRNMRRETAIGISAGDGLIILGRETELEEKLRKSGKELNDYIHGKRAELPKDIAPVEEFYK